MKEMIRERKEAEQKPERADLFRLVTGLALPLCNYLPPSSALLDASEAEGDEAAKLSDSDLTGNMFIFLVVGRARYCHVNP